MAKLMTQLRKAIRASDKTRYRISKDTDIDEAQLCNFMKGKAGLSIESMEKLADCLGLEVILQPKKRRKGK